MSGLNTCTLYENERIRKCWLSHTKVCTNTKTYAITHMTYTSTHSNLNQTYMNNDLRKENINVNVKANVVAYAYGNAGCPTETMC